MTCSSHASRSFRRTRDGRRIDIQSVWFWPTFETSLVSIVSSTIVNSPAILSHPFLNTHAFRDGPEEKLDIACHPPSKPPSPEGWWDSRKCCTLHEATLAEVMFLSVRLRWLVSQIGEAAMSGSSDFETFLARVTSQTSVDDLVEALVVHRRDALCKALSFHGLQTTVMRNHTEMKWGAFMSALTRNEVKEAILNA